MIAFEVKDMTCGHCAATITKAIEATDKNARLSIDLARHLVMIESAQADASRLQEAIAEAGYTPVPAEAQAAEVPTKTEGCCGHCR